MSLRYSFSILKVAKVGFDLIWTGFANYAYIYTKDATWGPILLSTVLKIAADVPLILIISFFTALMINQKFRGRTLARAIIFLPVIITSGILLKFETNSLLLVSKSLVEGQQFNNTQGVSFFSYNLYFLLRAKIGLEPTLINYVLTAIGEIYTIITLSGIQILIFLSALQTISPELKEAARIDGATGWESFWKITFPMVSPYILVCFIYTMIDNFNLSTSPVMAYINDQMFRAAFFANASAMGWSYALICIVLVVVVSAIASKGVFYEE
jgi:ABC-type sugar transport system permease subunit